jgi:predicted transcriptional regulator
MSLFPAHFCREHNERFALAAADSGSGLCTFEAMKTKKLTEAEALERVETWPPEAQDELADFALELDAGLSDGDYEPTPEEMAGIERGLRGAAEARFVPDQQVEAVFAKFRGK